MTYERPAASDEARPEVDVAALYREQYPPLLRVAYLVLGDQAAAEDIVQDAFLDFHRRGRRRLADPSRSAAYLRRVVINLARSHLRRVATLRRLRRLLPRTEARERDVDALSDVLSAVDRLPMRQRECLILKYYMDLPDIEIAETLGLRVSTVKTHLRRALENVTERVRSPGETY